MEVPDSRPTHHLSKGTPVHSTRPPRIAVVGAGLGGLTCARILQRHGRPVTVFEREASADTRPQGGSLDLHPDSGQAALRSAGLLDRFQALARPEGDEWRVLDPATAAPLAQQPPSVSDGERPEIDRGQLRGLLLDSLAEGTVRWGHAVDGVTPLADGSCRLLLADGTAEEFDLVIGADGAWSRARPALSPAVPRYTGVTFIETGFDQCATRHPEIARLVGNGSLLAKGAGRSLVAQRNSDDHIRAYLAFRAPQDWHLAAGLDLGDQRAVREYLSGLFEGWHESLRALLRDGDHEFVNRPLFVLPAPHTWRHVPGVTLLGDAAHLMPPVGLGANLAMLDGADLAHALVAEPGVDAAVRAYEAVMLPRSVEAATASARGLDHLVPEAAQAPAAATVR
ncbi:2-polyprenyl-6-methoxyphenol hydroxylase-like FAD-dependent oxidoreductase [Kitasatospora viridis]|uniref:Flavin-dependent monooxygenase n=1 Tax=Kitasatospora viridis TaxID=281105 RepID=A0A561T712_9ACTN|nr:2-polyprenyl-6-methoxyphenol hydroxylase-like FAD-dependent oxidoreductase [Kitasatospora viridis]